MRNLQLTISGHDAGGFVFQNVLNISTTDDMSPNKDVLTAILDEIDTVILPPYQAAMSTGSIILDTAARFNGLISSYTMHRPQDAGGARATMEYPGGVCSMLTWFPESGVHVGRMYVVGPINTDFQGDEISPTYLTLLEDLGDAFMTWDGTNATWGWQLLIVNQTALTAEKAVSYAVRHRPTLLNKRIRA